MKECMNSFYNKFLYYTPSFSFGVKNANAAKNNNIDLLPMEKLINQIFHVFNVRRNNNYYLEFSLCSRTVVLQP
jgi:hypothetical protein